MGRLDYLEQYESRNTVKNYKAALRNFFDMIYPSNGLPRGYRMSQDFEGNLPIVPSLEDQAKRYFETRDPEQISQDVQDFLVSLKEYAPKTVRLKLSAIRVFLIENDVELPAKFWRRLRGRIRGSRAVTVDRIPTNQELRKIVMHLPVRGKALFLTLASSGMRIDEALHVTLADIDLDTDPSRINLRGEYTKSGNKRVVFISREAREAIGEWLKVRDKYLDAAVRKSHLHDKSMDDPRVFPFNHVTSYVVWNGALKKAGFDKRDKQTKIHRVHPHVLRKFFRTQLGPVISRDIIEALLGHEEYLDAAYRRYTEEQLGKFYKQGEHALLIFTEAGEVTELRKEVEEQRDQLQSIVNGLTAENLELKSRVARTELTVTKLEKHIDSLQTTVKRIHETLERIVK